MNDVEDTPASAGASLQPLPLAYGYPFLTLLPRDPHHVFAQWEIPEATRREVWERSRQGRGSSDEAGANIVLRLFDVTTDLERFVDFAISERQTMHIRTERPGIALVAQIGLRIPWSTNGKTSFDGEQATFIPVVTSNVVRLPPGHAAEPGEQGVGWSWSAIFEAPYIFRAEPDFSRPSIDPGQTTSSDFALGR